MKKIIAVLLVLQVIGQTTFGQTLLSTDEFASMLRDSASMQLVDVRTANEYTEGHLANAKNIDFRSPEFAKNIENLDKSKPVMIYCLAGGRSAEAAKIFTANGFSRVYDLRGGYIKWSSDGKPSEGKSVPKKGSKLALANGEFSKLIDTQLPVLIDFTAKWCVPCQEMLPTVQKIEKEFEGRAIVKTIDYDANKQLSSELGISYLPALLLYKNGKIVWQKTGKLSEVGFRNLLNSYL